MRTANIMAAWMALAPVGAVCELVARETVVQATGAELGAAVESGVHAAATERGPTGGSDFEGGVTEEEFVQVCADFNVHAARCMGYEIPPPWDCEALSTEDVSHECLRASLHSMLYALALTCEEWCEEPPCDEGCIPCEAAEAAAHDACH